MNPRTLIPLAGLIPLATPHGTDGAPNARAPLVAVLTNLPGDATSRVPGARGLDFAFHASNLAFDRVSASPDGHWTLTAIIDFTPPRPKRVLLFDGELVARPGDPAPFLPGRAYGKLETNPTTAKGGSLAFVAQLDGAPFEVCVRRDPGPAYTIVAQRGAKNPADKGETFHDLHDPILLADRSVQLVSSTRGISTVAIDARLVAKSLETVLAGQPGGATRPWSMGRVLPDAAGTHHLITSRWEQLAYDGVVAIAAGEPLGGATFTTRVSEITSAHVDPAGNWYACGANGDGPAWGVRNGALVEVVPSFLSGSSGERWSWLGTFVGNSSGEWLVVGMTDAPMGRNQVVADRDGRVLVRQGDPIDIDGDGAPEPDLFLGSFVGPPTGVPGWTDAGTLYLVARLVDRAGAPRGSGLLRRSAH